MSDTPQGPGWWQASDLRWYPPESHPNFVAPATPAPEQPMPQWSQPQQPTSQQPAPQQPTPQQPTPQQPTPQQPTPQQPTPQWGQPQQPQQQWGTPQQPSTQQPTPQWGAPQPAPTKGNGCLKAFLIVLGIGAVIGVVLIAFLVFATNKIVDKVQKETRPLLANEYELTVDSCDASGAQGSFTNRTPDGRNFTVYIDFSSDTGGGRAQTTIGPVQTGEKTFWTVTPQEPLGGAVRCKPSASRSLFSPDFVPQITVPDEPLVTSPDEVPEVPEVPET